MKRIFWKRGIAGIAAMVMLLSLAAVGSMEEQVVYQEDFEKLTTESLASDGWAGTCLLYTSRLGTLSKISLTHKVTKPLSCTIDTASRIDSSSISISITARERYGKEIL